MDDQNKPVAFRFLRDNPTHQSARGVLLTHRRGGDPGLEDRETIVRALNEYSGITPPGETEVITQLNQTIDRLEAVIAALLRGGIGFVQTGDTGSVDTPDGVDNSEFDDPFYLELLEGLNAEGTE